MNNIELLDQLFAANRELMRLIIATASTTIPDDVLEKLVQRRDQINVQIQQVILADLAATVDQLEEAVASIQDSVAKLESFKAKLADINKAIDIARSIIDIVGGILAL